MELDWRAGEDDDAMDESTAVLGYRCLVLGESLGERVIVGKRDHAVNGLRASFSQTSGSGTAPAAQSRLQVLAPLGPAPADSGERWDRVRQKVGRPRTRFTRLRAGNARACKTKPGILPAGAHPHFLRQLGVGVPGAM